MVCRSVVAGLLAAGVTGSSCWTSITLDVSATRLIAHTENFPPPDNTF